MHAKVKRIPSRSMYGADHNRPIRGKSWVESVAREKHARDSRKRRSRHFCVKVSGFPAAMCLSVPESPDCPPTVPHSTIRSFSALPACAATTHCWLRKVESLGFFGPSIGFCACSGSWVISVRSAFTMRMIRDVRPKRAAPPDVAQVRRSQFRRPGKGVQLRHNAPGVRAKRRPWISAAGGRV